MIHFYQQKELPGENLMDFALENFASNCFFKKKKINRKLYQKIQGDNSLQTLLKYTIIKMIFWAEIFFFSVLFLV